MIRLRRRQVGQVESDQVVAQHEGRAVGEIVEPRQRGRQTTAGMDQSVSGIRAHRAQGMNAAAVFTDFKVERDAPW